MMLNYFTEYDSTSGDRISALDEKLKFSVAVLETECNKEEECAEKNFDF